MYHRFSRTPWLALVFGIYLELSIRNGICDDSQVTPLSYQKTSVKGDDESLTHRHAQSWKGWEDWLPSTKTEIGQQQHQQYVPLSPAEQAKLRYRRNRTENKKSVGQPRSSKNSTEKTGNRDSRRDEDSVIDLKSVRDMAKSLASSLINHFASSWSLLPISADKLFATSDSQSVPRSSRAIYLDNLGERQDRPNHGKPEIDAKRGVIDWLSRLIGVQGKTLGEFLREYQVHVLYDLAFTFFKWIFTLYAGLLIP